MDPIQRSVSLGKDQQTIVQSFTKGNEVPVPIIMQIYLNPYIKETSQRLTDPEKYVLLQDTETWRGLTTRALQHDYI